MWMRTRENASTGDLSLGKHPLCSNRCFVLGFLTAALDWATREGQRVGGEEPGLGGRVCPERGAWGEQGPGRDARGGGRSPGATASAPTKGRGAHAGQTRVRAKKGLRGGARGGGGRSHRSSRETGAVAVPQLLRRMLFRVRAQRYREQRWPGGAKSEARAECARTRWSAGVPPGAAGAPQRLLQPRLAGASGCPRWL